MQICEEGIARSIWVGKMFYLVVVKEYWSIGTDTRWEGFEGFTTKKEAERVFYHHTKDECVPKATLLKVIPGEQRWEILEAYERGK